MGSTCSKGNEGGVDSPKPAKNALLDTTTNVHNLYKFDKVLGKGNFGIVRLVTDLKTGQKYACKTISKSKLLTEEDLDDVKREIQVMNHLAGHPNIVELQGAFEDKQNIHLVLELCNGGELFDRIAERGHYTEKDAAAMIRNIVSVVHHCHNMNVVHRDLKPENFLLTEKTGGVLKATDFGLSRFFKDGEFLTDIVGSPFYVAPEVLRRKYGKEADIWSCGVILYILLCGWPPFHGDSTQQIFRNILTLPLDLNHDPWPKISEEAKDCVRRMLTRDPSKRATAAEILQHEWMKENGVALDKPIEPEVLNRMRGFSAMNKLKKEALRLIARTLPEHELVGIREMFKAMDVDNSGTITVAEMKEGLRKKGADLGNSDLEQLIASMDVDGNNKIDYEEFLAATVHLNKLEKEEHLLTAFKHFDKDDSGAITREELQAALKDVDGLGDIDTILEKTDLNKDGKIDYEEFCKMMRNMDQLQEAKRALKTNPRTSEAAQRALAEIPE